MKNVSLHIISLVSILHGTNKFQIKHYTFNTCQSSFVQKHDSQIEIDPKQCLLK